MCGARRVESSRGRGVTKGVGLLSSVKVDEIGERGSILIREHTLFDSAENHWYHGPNFSL